ncbi:MAG TPA: transcriptional activator NhaR [Gemmatimonadales bacterium]|nr:transcriptional activator NhaR [Gemmatimonadales bacterium]
MSDASPHRPALAWLNYHHLLYFYTVAREGSIARACAVLHLTQPTVSSQLRTLEEAFGEKLFERRGRGLVLTEMGTVVFRYAEEIFALGRELQEAVQGRPTGRPLRFRVGVAEAIPKLLAHRLLAPALGLSEPVRLVCREDDPDRLLADLSLHALDLVLLDAPAGSAVKARAFNHLLGESGMTIFGIPALARQVRRRFPRSLDGAPFLLPGPGTMLRQSLDLWMEREGIRPLITAEIGDSAVLKTFGGAGAGLFAAPSAVERDVCRQHQVRVAGRLPKIRERFYAVSVERRLKHPAVVAITQAARTELFG